MKALFKTLVFIFFFSLNLIAQVDVDSTNIKTFFYGPFNKTIVEVYFYNHSNRDSISANVTFRINKTAFIENLYLDINGKLKKDSTLVRRKGQEIYNRIVYRRIDPALLIESDEGEYTLNVYPFLRHQRRKVIIEYYSVLESDSSNFPGWFFNIFPASPNYLSRLQFVSSQEKTVRIIPTDQNVLTEIKKEVREKEIRRITVESLSFSKNLKFYFDFSNLNVVPVYFSDSIRFYQTNNGSIKNNYYVKYSNNSYLPDFIAQVLRDINNDLKPTIVFSERNRYLNRFLKYLKSQNITCLEEIGFGDDKIVPDDFNWLKMDNIYYYLDKNLTMLQGYPETKEETVKLNCPFLDKFIKYLSSLRQEESDQIKAGFLNSNLSKIVIENDIRAIRIWNDVVKRRNDFVEEPVYFCAVEEMPEPIGGLDSIMHSIFLPPNIKFEKDSFKVFLLDCIHKTGHSIDIRIIKRAKLPSWKSSIIDKIGMFAVSLPNWNPGKQRGKPVTVQVSVPIVFILNGFSQTKELKIGGREFNSFVQDTFKLYLLEKDFKIKDSEIIKFLSTQYFELMMKNPELIELSYKSIYLSNFDGIGFDSLEKGRTKSYLILK